MPLCTGPLRTKIAAAVMLAGLSGTAAAQTLPPQNQPVKAVADTVLAVATPAGAGEFRVYLSSPWTEPRPDVTRAVIVAHGIRRNADVYFKGALAALDAAGDAGKGSLMIAPQFLADPDIPAHNLPPSTLRWTPEGWSSGEPATAPAPLSSFDALDAILERLADRRLFPNLARVVVSGHSGGGQIVQRYAVAGHGEDALKAAGIAVRYVVANPSSYVYFSAERPRGDGTFGPFDAASCPGFDRWKYGMAERPPYAADLTPEMLESGYAARDVVYLLGAADIDPNHASLDKSCMARAEGPYRLARGRSYFAYLDARHGGNLGHRLFEVPDVGHDGTKMFGSACGLRALFDKPGCQGDM